MNDDRRRQAKNAGLAVLATAAIALASAWAVHWGGMAARTTAVDADPPVTEVEPAYPLKITLPPSGPVALPAKEQTSARTAIAMDDAPSPTRGLEPALRAPPADLPPPAAAAKTEPPRGPGGFDIRNFGTGGAAEDGVVAKTTKPLILGDRPLGAIELAVGRGASVSVDRRALSALLADSAPALSAALDRETSDRVTFDALRTRDVAIRYDPLRDAVVIDPRS